MSNTMPAHKLSRIGSLNRLTLSAYEPMLGEAGPLLGVPHLDTWIDCFVRTESGDFYWVVRSDRTLEPKEERRGVFNLAPPGERYMSVQRDFTQADFSTDASGVKKMATLDGRNEAVFGEKTCSWQEENLLDLRGSLLGPGAQAVFPTALEGEGAHQIYCNQQYLVEGTVRGERAQGFMLLERMYGTVSYLDSVWSRGSGTYTYFGNTFEDGSAELGFIYVGGELNGGLIYSHVGEEVVNTNDATFHPTINEEGIFTDGLYTFNGNRTWKFVMDPPGRAGVRRSYKPGDSTISFGYVTRVGETRKRRQGWAMANCGVTY